jgi:transcriptional regulator with XRE-family HTH domain
MTDAVQFGVQLRRHRERRGVSLAHIAHETKISRSLLSDLERGNLSRWPAGIFGRAFLRSYAEAVGLEPREVLTEFLGIVPAPEGLLSPKSTDSDEEPLLPGFTFKLSQAGFRRAAPDGTLRLTLAEPVARVRLRVGLFGRWFAAIGTDGAILLAGAAIGRLVIGPDGWLPGVAAVAVAIVVLGSTILGTTPGRRLFSPPLHARRARPSAASALPPLIDRESPEAAADKPVSPLRLF